MGTVMSIISNCTIENNRNKENIYNNNRYDNIYMGNVLSKMKVSMETALKRVKKMLHRD
jgi:hypothetical protein